MNLLKLFGGFDAQTFLVTNVPGGSLIKILDGCVLEKIVPIAPIIKSIGKPKTYG